jgi:hypothetical protein
VRGHGAAVTDLDDMRTLHDEHTGADRVVAAFGYTAIGDHQAGLQRTDLQPPAVAASTADQHAAAPHRRLGTPG